MISGSFMSVRCVLVPSREIPPHRLKEFKPRASPCLAKKKNVSTIQKNLYQSLWISGFTQGRVPKHELTCASPCLAKSKRFTTPEESLPCAVDSQRSYLRCVTEVTFRI